MIMLLSCRGRFGVMLGSVSGWFWGNFDVVPGMFWHRFGIVLGSFCDRFKSILVDFNVFSKIVPEMHFQAHSAWKNVPELIATDGLGQKPNFCNVFEGQIFIFF